MHQADRDFEPESLDALAGRLTQLFADPEENRRLLDDERASRGGRDQGLDDSGERRD